MAGIWWSVAAEDQNEEERYMIETHLTGFGFLCSLPGDVKMIVFFHEAQCYFYKRKIVAD